MTSSIYPEGMSCSDIGSSALGQWPCWTATDACGGVRSPLFAMSYLLGATPLLVLPWLARAGGVADQWVMPKYAVAFGVIGIFSGGPAHMYGTAVSADLAAAAGGRPGLVSSISGLIDGIGTLGAAIGEVVQVEPVNSMLKANATKCLNLKCGPEMW